MAFRVEADRRPLLIRLPQKIVSWLEAEALANDCSANSEIIRRLRADMDSEQPKKKATS